MKRFCLALMLVGLVPFAALNAEAAVVGGGRYIVREIQPGQTQTLRITLKGNKYYDFTSAFRFAASRPLSMTIVRDGVDSVWAAGLTNAYHNVWRPQSDCALVIRVSNPSLVPVTYQMWMQ